MYFFAYVHVYFVFIYVVLPFCLVIELFANVRASDCLYYAGVSLKHRGCVFDFHRRLNFFLFSSFSIIKNQLIFVNYQ